ncbi:cytochrome c biogenesis protein DipZ [Rhodobacter capsulatus]|uniref:cytochrome c biogenesis protein DipZ n=1 Tax=Rhodobacter capsulatus TaxID=1061 RepID=UPI004025C646
MALVFLAWLGGVLTILSPCILPVLPFVFARAGKPFWTNGLPMLGGMALAFSAVASLAALGGGWAVAANGWGRGIALALLGAFGLMLLFPALSERLTRPLVALGNRSAGQGEGLLGSVALGVATGLLWAPCAGPILGLILTGAALNGASLATTGLLFAYALGAATALAVALLAGGRVFALMKRGLGIGEGLRRGLGALVLVGVAAIALGLDTGVLTRLSTASTNRLEAALLSRFGPDGGAVMQAAPAMTGGPAMMAGPAMTAKGQPEALPVEGQMPDLTGAVQWLNSPPLTAAQLRGKVVLIDFWTYSCINCLRALPHVQAWDAAYRDKGLVVIGVHAPEFAFEKDPANVAKAVKDLGLTYPVALDNDYALWRAFSNRYWPAHYFVDAKGQIRHHHFGEGGYEESEQVIRTLLAEAGQAPDTKAQVQAAGVSAPADMQDVASPETYLGHARASGNLNPEGLIADQSHRYTAPDLRLNEWALAGDWTVGVEAAQLTAPGGSVTMRFHARDLHLVLAPGAAPVPFTVTIDGQPPGADAGLDVDAAGRGTVTEDRLYQLYRAKGPVADHLFEIRFDAPGVRAFAFTFG